MDPVLLRYRLRTIVYNSTKQALAPDVVEEIVDEALIAIESEDTKQIMNFERGDWWESDVYDLFSWRTSPQGENYWSEVVDGQYHPALNERLK